MRTAASMIADRTSFSEPAVMNLLSAAAEAADRMDPMLFVDEFDALAADEQLGGAEIDQRRDQHGHSRHGKQHRDYDPGRPGR